MKFNLTIIIFLLQCTYLIAQDKYARVDSIAGSVKGENLEAIHGALVRDLKSDEEKVRVFYRWIANNISYDVLEWQIGKKTQAKQEPAKVLKLRKAVCYGYSSLFREFCLLSAIPCYLVTGYTRINGRYNGEGHAWNVVFLNGKWQLLDVTWGAGSVDLNKKYIKRFNEDYFLTDPVTFLADHYPLDPMWQLLHQPVKIAEYKALNWKYTDKPGPVFAFNDTIAIWQKLDSLQKAYTSALRMIRYNPSEPAAQQELAFALFDMGDAEFDKGNELLNTPSMTKSKAHLDSAETHYKKADFYYRQVKLSDPAQREVLKNNMEALRYNRNVLNQQRQSHR